MMRALEDDFKQVVGISWYLWIFVVIFLLLNVNGNSSNKLNEKKFFLMFYIEAMFLYIAGWHTYFWIAFIPFIVSQFVSRPDILGAIGDLVNVLIKKIKNILM